jgi:hypothetical protein
MLFMPLRTPHLFITVCGLAMGITTASLTAAEPTASLPPAASAASALKPDTIYRLDLFNETLRPLPASELKPGAVYFRHSASSGRHVWSRFLADGSFEFAMGPGSVQPAWRFDIREGRDEQLRELEVRAPELYKRLITQGARPMLRLDDQGRWQIDLASNEGRVFDLETGYRWEWHGGRRVAVVHGSGRSWTHQAGRFSPAYTVVHWGW